MAFVWRDPWREQLFAPVPCPEGVVIPVKDVDAYQLFPSHRWVYNKLRICETQGLAHAPHGIEPERYPIFSKPIYNLRGMGTGSKVIRNADEYATAIKPGSMWMELLEGEHVSADFALQAGELVWSRHTVGEQLGDGMFDYWTVLRDPRAEVETYIRQWIEQHLGGHTGIVNFETINGKIIECHLRCSSHWVDLNGPGWLDAVVGLHAKNRWGFQDQRRVGYSLALFAAHGQRHSHPDETFVDALREWPEISSIQITFRDDWSSEQHAMPPGGFRLAVINCWDLEVGRRARRELGSHLGGHKSAPTESVGSQNQPSS